MIAENRKFAVKREDMETDKINEAVRRYCLAAGIPEGEWRPKAALIDMDGTLIDSMKSHSLAWQRLSDELGLNTTSDEFYLYEGMTGRATIKMLYKRVKGYEPSDEVCDELYKRKTRYFNEMPEVGTIPGAARMLDAFASSGITRVLVTGSKQLSNLDRLDIDFPGAFSQELRITASDVSHGKPDPEPYLKGMSLAGVLPTESIVIENAPLGVESGRRAGAFVLAATTGPIPKEAMVRAGADLVFDSMDELADMLSTILNS